MKRQKTIGETKAPSGLFQHSLNGSIHLMICSFFMLLLYAQTAPPTIQSVTPNGGTRGTTVAFLIDGLNLGDAKRVLFNGSGFSAKILQDRILPNKRPKPPDGVVVTRALIEDKASRHRLTVEVTIDAKVEPDIYGFRIQTPLGVTNLASFAVTPFAEVSESQSNNALAEAQPISLPVTVRGEITEIGDIDHFSFKAKAGRQLVFQILASQLGSPLDSLLTLLSDDGTELARNDDFRGRDSLLAYKIPKDGAYVVRVADAQVATGAEYRLQAGEFGYVTEVFPLGVQAGQRGTLKVRGYNLGPNRDQEELTVSVSEKDPWWGKTSRLSVPGALNKLRIAIGSYPEDVEHEPNNTVARAQKIALPATVNGWIFKDETSNGLSRDASPRADEDLFQFSARKGQHLVFEVQAQRLGSPLDSVLEILDTQGVPVSRAALRCVAETAVTLNDPDSVRQGIRIASWNDFAIDDYVMIGGELLQVESLPTHPDADIIFKGFLGRRIGFLDTTPEAHALGTPVYKVRIAPPGTEFPSNGMPVFRLNYRNDDGGAMHGKDSRLSFIASADGTYLVRIRDIRGLEGDQFVYRLTMREASPDFVLLTGREHLNLSPASQVPVTVTAYRLDGFDEEIEVTLEDLPAGLTATRAVIPRGADSTIVLVKADKDAALEPTSFRVVGRAQGNGQLPARYVDLERRLNLVAMASMPPDIQIAVDSREVQIIPGHEVQVTIRINRQNGFANRVPFDVRNLPHGVRVMDIGLNGVLITEAESNRTFVVYAEPWVSPQRRPFYAVGRVETSSFVPIEHSSDAIELVVLPQKAEVNSR